MNDAAQFLISHGLPLLFTVVFVEQLGLPIPALPWLLIAGALSASGQFNLPLGILVTVLACLFSDAIWFGLGRYRGRKVIGFFRRFLIGPKGCTHRTDKNLSKRGLIGVLLSKFIPGIGTVAPPLAGMFRLNPARFLFVDAVGSCLYAVCWLSVGYVFSPQISRIEAVIARIGLSLFILIVTAVIGYSIFKLVRRIRAPKPGPDQQTEPVNERNHSKGHQELPSPGTHTRDVGQPTPERLSERLLWPLPRRTDVATW